MSTPFIIAVMGPTGVGKSTFIARSGAVNCDSEDWTSPIVGNGLEACTSVPELYIIPETNIVLIDTPGFDDTYVSDRQILKRISDVLREYAESCKVTAILYIHQITDTRMRGSALKNLIMFKKLVGNGNMSYCTLVTTKWSDVDSATGARRESELLTNGNFWKPMIEAGARVERFHNTQESARSIISPLLQNHPFVP